MVDLPGRFVGHGRAMDSTVAVSACSHERSPSLNLSQREGGSNLLTPSPLGEGWGEGDSPASITFYPSAFLILRQPAAMTRVCSRANPAATSIRTFVSA